MVSFSCGRCGDVVKKPKVQSHAAQCGTGSYSCVDCMTNFDLHTVNNHSSCMSEVQKYQGKYVPDYKKSIAKDSDDSDCEVTKKRAHMMKRTSRPKLSFTDSDDSDSDKKPAAKKAAPKKAAVDSDSDDDVPAKKAPVVAKKVSPKLAAKKVVDSDSDDDVPAKKAPVVAKKVSPKLAAKKVVDSDSDDAKPAPKKASPILKKKAAISDSDDDEVPAKKAVPAPVAAVKAALAAPKRVREATDSDSEDEKPVVKAKVRISSPIAPVKASSTKLEALSLPASNVAPREYCISEHVPLGTADLVNELVDDILAENNGLNAAAIAQEIVIRYKKRLGKAVEKAIAPVLKQRGL